MPYPKDIDKYALSIKETAWSDMILLGLQTHMLSTVHMYCSEISLADIFYKCADEICFLDKLISF